ncbi:MAG TPA: ATP-binding protein, partial [Puia sp.]|nr:ATP-binding protein [Puia sp.]
MTTITKTELLKILDLKNAEIRQLRSAAEEHEREVFIEAAFQRVRAMSMAMHKSAQLADTAKVLFDQFGMLGMIPDRMSIGIFNEEKRVVELWVTDQRGNQLSHEFFFSIDEPTSIAKIYDAWKQGKNTVIVDLTGQNLQDWLHFVKDEAKLPLDETEIKGRRVQQAAFFSQGFLLFTTHEPVTEEVMQLLLRFAKVFDLAYTRFRDLLRAEDQTRKAIRSSALDRVRAEIASMRTVSDLQRITPIIWHELTVLGIPFIRCGVFIIDEANENVRIYLSAPDGHPLATMNLAFNSNKLTDLSVDHWRRGIVFTTHWNKDDFLNWMQAMINQGHIQNRYMYLGDANPPESLDLHFIPFRQGMLYVGNSEPYSQNEIDVIRSLAEAFSIAYTRYEDFNKLEQAKQSIESALTELKATQNQLIQSEKMASLGELTAGIAHEIQNPLNFVNNFSEVNQELVTEIKSAIDNGNIDEARSIADNIEANEQKINHHGKRADAIVKSMLQHSQLNKGEAEPTDVNSLAGEYLRLAYHGFRAKDKTFSANLETHFDPAIGNIYVVSKDIGRVLLNLYNNAFYTVSEKKKFTEQGFVPAISVSTRRMNDKIEINIQDNGKGIPQQIIGKIFQPFFTTKPAGQGTGLGLSLSYDIIKSHRGNLIVETKEGEGSQFTIQ